MTSAFRRINIIIQPFAIKNMLDSAAARLSMPTGKGQKTFRAIFETGIRLMRGIVLPFTREAVKGEWAYGALGRQARHLQQGEPGAKMLPDSP